MTKRISPVHYDVVGSYLRPAELKTAKADFKAGKISASELQKIEEESVAKLIEKQKNAGLRVITDGEYRRTYWHLDFMWGFQGVGHEQTGGGVQFNGELAKLEDTFLVDKINYKHHPFIDHFKFTKQFEDSDHVAKLTVPAPAQVFQQMIVPQNYQNTIKIYGNLDNLASDIAKAYQEFVKEFYKEGGRRLQFDDCTWGAIVGDAAEQRYKSLNLSLDTVKQYLLDVNNGALSGRPDDLAVATHICRGNYHSTYFTSGPYDSVADYVFAKENVDTLYLEYDDARSGGFEPLAKVSADKHVVLGLITTKSHFLEHKDKVIERINEASKYIPLDRLSLSPQCGFASCEVGNKLTEQQQFAKIALVKEIADEVWK
ncbi:MAG: 5-methyltetrahydropteroyltriglutamate--homocysteine S-methyltransferase [Candidatus Saccharibacteria bacterium]|nr:5-methyltetrahydropteroyltriglutamate--homocysteine S-methyltransferase [Candidatus Saccharibacteria bacterium]